jgi:3-hydroxyisobutyrate dehydrogenase-like beta-hydroxyacid dehydrogenase
MPHRFGLLGHGVVGSLFARLLHANGADVMSYDVLLGNSPKSRDIRSRIVADGALPGALEEVVLGSEVILAITPVHACRDAAARAAVHLTPRHIYCDLASAPPSLKQELAATVEPTGAKFVEGAILGAVGASLSCPAILLGGEFAPAASELLNRHGLRTSAYSADVGPASAFKMIRSVFSKGMETLLIETLVSAQRAGLREEIWSEILATLAPDRMQRMLETWIRSHAISSERRYHEMLEVTNFLEELNVAPSMTRAAVEVFRRSNEGRIAEAFEKEPDQFTDVIDFLSSNSAPRP